MSRPPSYDAFLRAQREFDNQHFGRPVYSPKEAVRENSNPNAIKHKINELLDLCKSENKDIKKEFQGVLSAEEDILMMLKEQLNRDPTTSQYVRSNVENFSPYVQRDPNMQRAPKKEFFKSKVHELMDLNRPLKDHQSIMKTEQQENMYLRQEINRLKNLIPKYEAEFRKIKKSSDSNTKLFDVLEQGQKIRQETILLLKSKSVGSFSRQTEGKQQFLKELGKLRKRCQQLEEENHRLKRYSKEAEYTSAPRYFS